jgi:hypothetical protein
MSGGMTDCRHVFWFPDLRAPSVCKFCGKTRAEAKEKPSHYLLPIHPSNVEFVKRVGVSLGKVNVDGVGDVDVWDLP